MDIKITVDGGLFVHTRLRTHAVTIAIGVGIADSSCITAVK